MIRKFEEWDVERAKLIHQSNGLDPRCFPPLTVKMKNAEGEEEEVPNALFVSKEIYEHDGTPAMMCFTKITGELFFLVDHDIGTPEQRWGWLREFKEYIAHEAWKLGLDQLTCWIPPEIEISFAKRLKDLGFQKSPWQSYTLNLK
jgi:hypothetical protein